jgi:hypothetical protein
MAQRLAPIIESLFAYAKGCAVKDEWLDYTATAYLGERVISVI